MFIFEEYLTRHSFDVAYVKHTLNGSLFFRHNNQWRIINIRWSEQGNHPGLYNIRYYEPQGHRYDKLGGDRTGVTLRRAVDDAHIYWEEYEKYLVDWAKKLTPQDIARTQAEAKLAAWEICLFSFDALLVGYANNENFFNTVNLDLPVNRRIAAVDRILTQIKRDERSRIREPIMNFWEAEIIPYIGSHCDWLVKIVERHGNQTY